MKGYDIMPKYNELKDWELLVHFTSIDNLMKILITDSIRLSNINLVNDSYEFLDIELGGTKVLDEEDYKRNCDLNDNEYQRMLIAKELAKESDLVIVVGSKKSANTTHLAEILKDITKTIHIENDEELVNYKELIEKSKNISITAGASTPQNVIERVIKTLRQ